MFNKIFLYKNRNVIEGIVLIIALALALIGLAITDVSPTESHRYWVLMIILFAIASIGLGWSRDEYQGMIFKQLVIRQLIHWGATLATVSGVYFLLNAGRLNYESTGLVIELIIGLSLFLDGRNLGWRFSLLGLLVSISAIIAAFVEEYIWLVLIISLALSVLIFYWEKYHHKKIEEQEYTDDFK